MKPHRRGFAAAAALGSIALAFAIIPAVAQEDPAGYPTRPIHIVVGFAGLLDLGYAAFFAIGAYTYGILTAFQLQPEWSAFWEPFHYLGLVAPMPGETGSGSASEVIAPRSIQRPAPAAVFQYLRCSRA